MLNIAITIAIAITSALIGSVATYFFDKTSDKSKRQRIALEGLYNLCLELDNTITFSKFSQKVPLDISGEGEILPRLFKMKFLAEANHLPYVADIDRLSNTLFDIQYAQQFILNPNLDWDAIRKSGINYLTETEARNQYDKEIIQYREILGELTNKIMKRLH
jgi:hypothetical protein